MVEMWERAERLHILLIIAAAIVTLAGESLTGLVLSWAAILLMLLAVLRSSGLGLLMHWRSILVYIGNIIFAILFAIHEKTRSDSSKNGLFAMSIIMLILTSFSSLVLFLLPVPSARPLNGKYPHIATFSFDIPVPTLQPDGSTPIVMMPVQCWYPLPTPTILERIYYILFQPNAAMWTSGSPSTQAAESNLLLKQIAHIYGMPSFIFQHLSLARTNSLYKLPELRHMISGKKFPIAIYSHGMYGWRTVHHTCAEQLASHGFIVFAADHAPDAMISRPSTDLSKAQTFDYFLPEGYSKPQERVFYTFGFNRRTNDVITLIDYIVGARTTTTDNAPTNVDGVAVISDFTLKFPSFKEVLNVNSIHVWGHSFGGGTMSTVCARDVRVSSAAILDGWMYPMPDADRIIGSVNASILNISSHIWQFGKYQFPFRADYIKNSLSQFPSARAYDLVLTGTDHQNYCDVNLTANKLLLQKKSVLGPERDPFEVMEQIDNIVTAFFQRHIDASEKKMESVLNVTENSSTDDLVKVKDVEVGIVNDSGEPLLTGGKLVNGKTHFSTDDLIDACYRLDCYAKVPLLSPSTQAYMKKYLIAVEDLNDSELSSSEFFNRVTKGTEA